MNGDASLFARSDEVEQAWQIIDPIIAAWRSPAAPVLHTYETGVWGLMLQGNGCTIKIDSGSMFVQISLRTNPKRCVNLTQHQVVTFSE